MDFARPAFFFMRPGKPGSYVRGELGGEEITLRFRRVLNLFSIYISFGDLLIWINPSIPHEWPMYDKTSSARSKLSTCTSSWSCDAWYRILPKGLNKRPPQNFIAPFCSKSPQRFTLTTYPVGNRMAALYRCQPLYCSVLVALSWSVAQPMAVDKTIPQLPSMQWAGLPGYHWSQQINTPIVANFVLNTL